MWAANAFFCHHTHKQPSVSSHNLPHLRQLLCMQIVEISCMYSTTGMCHRAFEAGRCFLHLMMYEKSSRYSGGNIGGVEDSATAAAACCSFTVSA